VSKYLSKYCKERVVEELNAAVTFPFTVCYYRMTVDNFFGT